jgi:hypothetical protein
LIQREGLCAQRFGGLEIARRGIVIADPAVHLAKSFRNGHTDDAESHDPDQKSVESSKVVREHADSKRNIVSLPDFRICPGETPQ